VFGSAWGWRRAAAPPAPASSLQIPKDKEVFKSGLVRYTAISKQKTLAVRYAEPLVNGTPEPPGRTKK